MNQNFLKANIDVGCLPQEWVSWGFVIKNHDVEMVFATSKRTYLVPEVVVVEVYWLHTGTSNNDG